MAKTIRTLSLFICSISLLFIGACDNTQTSQVKPVKNVILLIPDGTSMGIISAARWYQIYNGGNQKLNIDPYFCGVVRTCCSNAPIGDSAPTTSCYMTGMLSKAGNVACYPEADPQNDLIPVDPKRAYQPLTTILEAARIEQNKATGLVVTCEFPHATPADCAAHYYDRKAYDCIAPQMVNNNLDVMFGGGNSILTDEMKEHFKITNTLLLQNDLKSFKAYNGDQKIWALFGDMDMPFDIDRDTTKYPSLAEMTKLAINRLSKNKNGFFLMVEGSKVDWAAHANDATGCITEFLAFDKAVGEAIDFAKKDGNTVVVILSDHGNSGFTIGRRNVPESYAKASISELFETVSGYKLTSEGMEKVITKANPEDIKGIFKQYCNIDLTEKDFKDILSTKSEQENDYTEMSYNPNLRLTIINIMNKYTPFGFTTGGHTAEDVQLAVYNPNNQVPMGMVTNIEINDYLFKIMGLKTPLEEMTKDLYADYLDVFKGLDYNIDNSLAIPTLTIKTNNKILVVKAFSSIATLNGESFDLGSVAVYVNRNNTFYIPNNLREKLM